MSVRCSRVFINISYSYQTLFTLFKKNAKNKNNCCRSIHLAHTVLLRMHRAINISRDEIMENMLIDMNQISYLILLCHKIENNLFLLFNTIPARKKYW